MSESLNRAFIKAYDKEKISEAKRKAIADERESRRVSELVMHFDTATVAIPSPHMLNARPEKSEVPVGSATPAEDRVLQSAKKESQAATESRVPDANPTEASLRDSIATQMLRAGDWQDQRIDAFIGGFPMLSPVYASGSRSSVTAANPSSSESPIVPMAELKHVETLEAPLEPALSINADASTVSPPRESVSKTQNLAAKIEKKNREGVIFRLDRPSYAQTQQPATGDELPGDDDSGAQSSIRSNLSASIERVELPQEKDHRSQNPIEETSDAPAVKSSTKTESTRAVEEDLRRARMRIFNPVWEVDSLQWPQVCLELLEQMNQKMNRVASNLISACEEGLQILAVTSPQSGEGTTTVACCLALLAGGHGLNVAIVDGNIDNPTLSYQTNLDVDSDWLAAILNQMPLEEVAVHSIDDQVTLVPLLNPISRQDIEADDERIASMLQELSESFDLVIVDMGNMNSTRSLVTTMGEQGLINAAVAVVDYRSSTPQTIENCIRQIRQAGITSIGLVENFAA